MSLTFAINFKAYVFGNNALEIAKIIDEYARDYPQYEVIIAVPLTELKAITSTVKYVDVFAQTVDNVGLGAYTGKTPIEALVMNGARGVVLNHSENQITLHDLESIIQKAKDYNLRVLGCASTPPEAVAISEIGCDYVAYEPPELIGTGKSVNREYPQSIKEVAKKVKISNVVTKFLVGAGITTYRDVEESIYLGAEGVFISSAIMKAKNIRQKLDEFFSFHYKRL